LFFAKHDLMFEFPSPERAEFYWKIFFKELYFIALYRQLSSWGFNLPKSD